MNPIEELIFYSELSKLKLMAQLQDFLTFKNKEQLFRIDADHLEHIQQQFVALIREDAKFLSSHTSLISVIYKSEFGQILNSPINFIQNKLFNKKPNKPQITIMTEFMILRQVFKTILELPLQINKPKDIIYLGEKNSHFENHFKIFFPLWNLKYIENYLDLNIENHFELIIFNYFFSKNPSKDLIDKINSKFNGTYKIVAVDFINYQDDPNLFQVVRQLEINKQIKISPYYQDFKFLKDANQRAFHSKILVW